MSAPKLTPMSAFVVLGLALQALPALAQSTATAPVMSFPTTNVEVFIDGEKQMQNDHLYINARQCQGSRFGENDAGTAPETPVGDGGLDAATEDAGTETDAATDDSGVSGDTAALITKAIGGDGAAEVTVVVSNMASTQANGAMVLEFWMGMDTTQDCSTPANRMSPTTNQGRPPCIKLPTTIRTIDTKKQTITFSATELFTNPYNAVTDPPTICDLQGVWTLYVVPLVNETPTTGTPGPALGPTIFVRFEPDFVPLPAVTGVTGGRGETEVTVNWSAASGANQLTQYKVLFDKTSVQSFGTGPCTSSIVAAGESLPFSLADLDQNVTKGTALTIDPASLGLDVNERITTGVVSLDAAGNESDVSNLVCVERVATTGFWDACNQNSNCKDGFDTCSLSISRDRMSWAGWTLGALGLALWMRRRRTM